MEKVPTGAVHGSRCIIHIIGEGIKTMSSLYSDTHPKMEALQIEIIRRMPAWKKMSGVNGLNEAVKSLAISGIKQRHPNASPEQIHLLLAELMLGKELAQKVYSHAR
jgi:hypothetical protein